MWTSVARKQIKATQQGGVSDPDHYSALLDTI